MRILVTCPPMLAAKDSFRETFAKYGWDAVCPNVVQVLSEEELKKLAPTCDGWIIGDDPATAAVFEAAKAGKLRAAVKWGAGVDNVDFDACAKLGIKITNTPGMFGAEVADLALGYIIALARQTFRIDRMVRAGEWPKYSGVSLSGKTVGIVGFGNIGSSLAKRLDGLEMTVVAWDPGLHKVQEKNVTLRQWPDELGRCDFVVLTCSLNAHNRHMLNEDSLRNCKDGVRIINVARGPLINEVDLAAALASGSVHSAALDVFETEPLPEKSELRRFENCVFGSHNGSNTFEAVEKTNNKAISIMKSYLGTEK